jgi:hypothetical protein
MHDYSYTGIFWGLYASRIKTKEFSYPATNKTYSAKQSLVFPEVPGVTT